MIDANTYRNVNTYRAMPACERSAMSELENTQQDTVTCDKKKSDLEPSIIDRPTGTVDRQVEDVAGLRTDSGAGLQAEDATGLQADSAANPQVGYAGHLPLGGSIEREQDAQAYGVLDIERSDEMSGVAGPKGGDRTMAPHPRRGRRHGHRSRTRAHT